MMRITNFSRLTYAINQLGVTISKQAKEYQERLYEGIDLDNDKFDEYYLGKDGIFAIDPDGKIHKVILHITQITYGTYKPISQLTDDWREWHKFHILNCTTIKKYAKERKHRYKMVSRPDGLFAYTIYKRNEVYKEFKGKNRTRLKLCRYCERLYEDEHGEAFDLEKFIKSTEIFSGLPATRDYDYQDVPNQYSKDWPGISKMRKKQKKWRCENCGIDLSERNNQKYLHAHHVDGNKANSSIKNIEVLCIKCHAEQSHHGHLKKNPDYLKFIEEVYQ